MTTLREAAQQALEALDVAASCIDGYYVPRGKTTLPEIEEAQKALRAALAQQTLNAPEECEHKADGWYAVQRVAGVTRVWPMTEAQALRAALTQQAEPVEPVAWQCREHGDSEWFDCGKESYGINPRRYTYRTLYTAPPPPQRPAESVPEPYTDDVTRLMRDAGMTFHLGLPHKAVVEQMTRVVDLVYAEASIKAAQQFATPPQRKPLTEEGIMDAVRESDLDWQAGWTLDEHEPNRFATLVRAVERAHGIKE